MATEIRGYEAGTVDGSGAACAEAGVERAEAGVEALGEGAGEWVPAGTSVWPVEGVEVCVIRQT